jgi:hypothetical protein
MGAPTITRDVLEAEYEMKKDYVFVGRGNRDNKCKELKKEATVNDVITRRVQSGFYDPINIEDAEEAGVTDVTEESFTENPAWDKLYVVEKWTSKNPVEVPTENEQACPDAETPEEE